MLKPSIAFQPIVCSDSGIRKAYEVLARFPGANGQFEGPLGHVALGQWASLDLSIIEMLATWVAMGNRLRHPLYINLSAETLSCDDSFEAWEEQYNSFQIYEKTPVMLEINESVHSDAVEKRWSRLTACGLGLALDDFGSKNASLERLKAYPWSACKFESQSFQDADSQAAFCYARTNQMVSIVERIETAQQATIATQAGVTLHQGFYYSPPQVVALDYAVTAPAVQLSEVV
tara:strand:- start:698 stop:1393 length:696 start_codon:yes stop_codon:yes gene_type:complete